MSAVDPSSAFGRLGGTDVRERRSVMIACRVAQRDVSSRTTLTGSRRLRPGSMRRKAEAEGGYVDSPPGGWPSLGLGYE
jgi:hypothetical protein